MLLCKKIVYCTWIEGSHHVNWNSIICRKRAVHTTEIERPFWAANGFNINLVQFLPLYHINISCACLLFYVHHFPRAGMCTLSRFVCTKSHVRKIINYEGLTRRNNFYSKASTCTTSYPPLFGLVSEFTKRLNLRSDPVQKSLLIYSNIYIF